jgi:hypothetical protein
MSSNNGTMGVVRAAEYDAAVAAGMSTEVLPSERAELERDPAVTAWCREAYKEHGFLDAELAACCEAYRMFVEAVKRAPQSAAELDGWMEDGSVLEAAAGTVVEEQATPPSPSEEELAEQQAKAGETLGKVAVKAGKLLFKAEVGSTVASVEAGRLVREGLLEYVAVYPRGRQAGEQIVVGKLVEVTGKSYKLRELEERVGIADVCGDESLKLPLGKFRELGKLVERTQDESGWQFVPGVEAECRHLVERVVAGEPMPEAEFRTQTLELAAKAEVERGAMLRETAAKLVEEGKALGDTKEGRAKLLEADVNEQAAVAADKRADMWGERVAKAEQKASDKAAGKAGDKAAAAAAKQASGTESVAPPSNARDVALAYIEDMAKGTDKDAVLARIAMAVKLIGTSFSAMRDVMIQCGDRFSAEQKVVIGLDMVSGTDGVMLGMVKGLTVEDTDIIGEMVDGIRATDHVRKTVVKVFGRTQSGKGKDADQTANVA